MRQSTSFLALALSLWGAALCGVVSAAPTSQVSAPHAAATSTQGHQPVHTASSSWHAKAAGGALARQNDPMTLRKSKRTSSMDAQDTLPTSVPELFTFHVTIPASESTTTSSAEATASQLNSSLERVAGRASHARANVWTVYHGTYRDSVSKMAEQLYGDRGSISLPRLGPEKLGDFSYKGGFYVTTRLSNAIGYVSAYKDRSRHGGLAVIEFKLTLDGLRVVHYDRNTGAEDFHDRQEAISDALQHRRPLTQQQRVDKHTVDRADVIIGTKPMRENQRPPGMSDPFQQLVIVTQKGMDALEVVTVHELE